MPDDFELLSNDELLDIVMDESSNYSWTERDTARRLLSRRINEGEPTPTWKIVLRLHMGTTQAKAMHLADNFKTLPDVRLVTVEQDLVMVGLCQSCERPFEVPDNE